MFDVIVIGGGVIGGAILRELTKYRLSVCMLEKENDVCMGQSKANSGIVHAGFDAAVGTLKAKFNVLGNKMMPEFAKELGIKYLNNGSLVVAFSEEELQTLQVLKLRGEKNGVPDMEILSFDELKAIEPNVSDNALGALYAKTGGIICPYSLTIAAIGNATFRSDTASRSFAAASGSTHSCNNNKEQNRNETDSLKDICSRIRKINKKATQSKLAATDGSHVA